MKSTPFTQKPAARRACSRGWRYAGNCGLALQSFARRLVDLSSGRCLSLRIQSTPFELRDTGTSPPNAALSFGGALQSTVDEFRTVAGTAVRLNRQRRLSSPRRADETCT
eukprot:5607268-Prymnesium_polylepis.1